MNIESQLQEEQKQLERMKEQHNEKLKEWNARLEDAREKVELDQYGAIFTLSRLESEFDVWKRSSEQEIASASANVDLIRSLYVPGIRTIPDDSNSADSKEKAAIKEKLLSWWIRSGGDPERFEAAFPRLYHDELERRRAEKNIWLIDDHR